MSNVVGKSVSAGGAVPPPSVSSPRLAVVISHPTQYYSPWFRALEGANPRIADLRVFYLWQFGVTAQRDPQFAATIHWDVDLQSGYEHEFVPNVAQRPGTDHFFGLRNPELPRRLAAWRPDAVLLFGYKWAAHLRAIAWARRHGVPLLFRGDSHFLGRGTPPAPTRMLLRTLYAQFAAFLTVGAANRDYFRQLAVPERKLFFAPHAVDDTLFDPSRTDHRTATQSLRARLRLAPATRVVLFAGKLIPAKQPGELLDAFVTLAPADAALVFVGDGSEKTTLQARAQATGNVHFLPFANQSAMPAHLLLADVFALPSRGHYETWGLAVNEAMHMGVPALVSDLVGCQRDLVTEGETGWIFGATNRDGLRHALVRALAATAQPDERARLRSNVERRIAAYTYRQTTAGLLAALNSVGPPSR